MALVKVVEPNEHNGRRLWLWCPGCDELHQVTVMAGPLPGPVWSWDGEVNRPTIDPSILVRGGRNGEDHVCHSFVRDAHWEFLGDCTHALAGQTVPMVDLPEWMRV